MNSPEPTLVNRATKAASAAHVKNALRREFPAADVSRVLGMIDVWAEVKKPSCARLQYARSKWHMNGLASSPWLDPNRFAFKPALMALYPTIRAEVMRVIDGIQLPAYGTVGGSMPRPATHPEGWREACLFSSFYDRGQEMRLRFPETVRIIPKILQSNKLINEFGLLVLEPNTTIDAHTDPWNFMVNLHLPLIVRENCGLRVGAETRVVREGELLAFDTSYLHSAWNRGTSRRVVLLIRTLHPALTGVEMKAMEFLISQLGATGHPSGNGSPPETSAI